MVFAICRNMKFIWVELKIHNMTKITNCGYMT